MIIIKIAPQAKICIISYFDMKQIELIELYAFSCKNVSRAERAKSFQLVIVEQILSSFKHSLQKGVTEHISLLKSESQASC